MSRGAKKKAGKELSFKEKGALVREVLGENAFDPWQRLGEKAKRGLDIGVEARYLEMSGIKPVSDEGQKMRQRYLASEAPSAT